MAVKSPNEGHRKRLRQTFRINSIEGMQPHEQIELLLTFSLCRQDTKQLGKALLKRFGSRRGILDAGYEDLIEVEGIGEQTATLITMVGEFARSYETDTMRNTRIMPGRTEAYVAEQIGRKRKECAIVVCLDAKSRILCSRILGEGSATHVSILRRDLVRIALGCEATGVLIGHNHPRGTPMPSQADISEAGRIRKTLEELGITMVDFIVVGEKGETYSILRSGLL
ncbi:MAG: hypothetical protein LBR72_08985 [Oscillospiraceae bacterium]|jgi:DNA repair protein RadC|nr:hypothetical protein [Oscillospiraceae bacterium]